MKAEAKHLERYNQAQIASQKEMLLLKGQVIHRQQTLNIVMGLLAVFILTCCIIFYRSYRLKQLMNVSLEEQIRARTHQLECSRNELLATLNERDALLSRAEKEVMETMTTIKGLCHTGKEELSRFATYSYLEKIENVAIRLGGHLRLMFGNKTVRPKPHQVLE